MVLDGIMKLEPVPDLQLAVHVVDMGFDRFFRNEEPVLDLLVAVPLQHQQQHFLFPFTDGMLFVERTEICVDLPERGLLPMTAAGMIPAEDAEAGRDEVLERALEIARR